VTKIEMIFYSSGECESDNSRRVAYRAGVNSMLQFRLESGGDGTKHCQKMKQRQGAHLGSMGMKYNMVR
jgi:hypothetical protein